MKIVALISFILLICWPLVWSQDSLMIKKVKDNEISRMKKEKVIDYDLRIAANNPLARQLYYRNYMIYTKNDVLGNTEVFSLMKPYEQAYKMMSVAESKIVTIKITELVFSTGELVYVIFGRPKHGASDKEIVTFFGIIAGIGVIGGITVFALKDASFKDAKIAVDLYNSGLKISSKIPKSELKFGITTNGLGLRCNF